MKKGSVKQRIFQSNAWMVFTTLFLFLGINLLVIYCYSESIENEVKNRIENVVDPSQIKSLLKDYTIYRNEFILIFALDGLLCIVLLILISQIFTKKLTEHIMEPLNLLVEGTKRIKENNLTEKIQYAGDEEFETVCIAFNEMMESIALEQEKNQRYEKARTDMIAGISHDLRTPLTAMKGSIKVLKDGIIPKEEQDKFLDVAERRSDEMEGLLNQLFYFSKLETGNMPFYFEEIDLVQFLEDYVKGKEEINLDIKVQSEIISADSEQLRRILDNLIENSRKYAQSESLKIDITMVQQDNRVTVCVKDNGIGVAEDQLPYLFNEFYRVDESRNKKEGNGLGLYIVKVLMEAMSAKVSAKNEHGLAIYLDFPLMSLEVEKDAES